MTGILVSVEDMHVIVVEGGPKQQRQYKKLMLNRINWGEELVGQRKGVAKEEDEGQRNECTLIWEGTVPKREFNTEPKIQVASDHRAAREIFSQHNVAHYWDHCFSHSVLLSSTSKT
jgi:U4/U6 small nuclear ribonucleoprotein PRP3